MLLKSFIKISMYSFSRRTRQRECRTATAVWQTTIMPLITQPHNTRQRQRQHFHPLQTHTHIAPSPPRLFCRLSRSAFVFFSFTAHKAFHCVCEPHSHHCHRPETHSSARVFCFYFSPRFPFSFHIFREFIPFARVRYTFELREYGRCLSTTYLCGSDGTSPTPRRPASCKYAECTARRVYRSLL